MREEDNLKDWSLTELVKEYIKELDKGHIGFFKNPEKLEKLRNELLRRGFPIVKRKGLIWTNGHVLV